MTRKKTVILIITLFILIILITGFLVIDWMSRVTLANSEDSKTIRTMYQEKKDSLDGIFIGTSAAYRFWNAPLAYEKHGICVYNAGTLVQPLAVSRYVLEDVQKYHHNLKFAVIEIRNISKSTTLYNAKDAKRVTDAMPYSSERKDAIDYYLEYCNYADAPVDMTPADYHLPMLRDHGRWIPHFSTKKVRSYYEESDDRFKGYVPRTVVTPLEDEGEITVRQDLSEAKIRLLDDLTEYCSTLDFDVIFVASPMNSGEWRNGLLNSACDYIESKGFTVLNFNLEPLRSQLAMDWSREFYDVKHSNIYGAERYTEFLSEYLLERYDLTDHRGQDGYESWDRAVKALNKRVDEALKKKRSEETLPDQ